MEQKLTADLLACAAAYCEAQRIEESTLGKLVVSDARFFGRLRDPFVTFNARTYDRALAWFSTNWPKGVRWPAGVKRPSADAGEVAR